MMCWCFGGFFSGFFFPPKWTHLTKSKDRIIYGEEGNRKNQCIFLVFLNHKKTALLTVSIPAARWALCCSAEIQSLGFIPWLSASWAGEGRRPCPAGLLPGNSEQPDLDEAVCRGLDP